MEVIYATPKIASFIAALGDSLIARTLETVSLLEAYGHELRMPHSRSLGSGLFELRLPGRHAIRLFYCFHKRRAYVLHIFLKKTKATPKRDIAYARSVQGALV